MKLRSRQSQYRTVAAPPGSFGGTASSSTEVFSGSDDALAHLYHSDAGVVDTSGGCGGDEKSQIDKRNSLTVRQRQAEQKILPRRKRGRPREQQRASKSQIFFGSVLSIFLLIFISGIDFQDETKNNLSKTRTGMSEGECLYDGHCPFQSSCGAVSRSGKIIGSGTAEQFGMCEAIQPKKKGRGVIPEATNDMCIDACLQELQRDEHWFHGSQVSVEWSEDILSTGRPDGCLIVYKRQRESNQSRRARRRLTSVFSSLIKPDVHTKDIPRSLLDWVDRRFHHLKRVDPYDMENKNDDRWMAFCTSPCRSNGDCSTLNSNDAFICQDGACVRNPQYWPTDENKEGEHNMVIVTGATSGYFRGLSNLAASARYWAPKHKMVVYNLGMKEAELERIRSWSNVLSVEWPEGVPDEYPAHVKLGKKYAWKPIIVNETVNKYGSIFWMDAGSTLAGPIQPIIQATQNTGIMLFKGQDLDMYKMSHPDTYRWFGYNKESMITGPHFSGNTQAFLYPSRYIDTVVIPNAKCALDEQCISPKGSSLGSHRFDQTSISILAYAPKIQLPHYTEFLAAMKDQLNPDLSKPSYKFIWTARQSCHYYSDNDAEAQGDTNLAQAGPQHVIHGQRVKGGAGSLLLRGNTNDASSPLKEEHDGQQKHVAEGQQHSQRHLPAGSEHRVGLGLFKRKDKSPKFTEEQKKANEEAEIARHRKAGGILDNDDETKDVDDQL